MELCQYGCNQEAKFQMSNGKKCCSKTYQSCPEIKSKLRKGNVGKKRSKEFCEKNRQRMLGKVFTEEHKAKMRGPRPSMLGNKNAYIKIKRG